MDDGEKEYIIDCIKNFLLSIDEVDNEREFQNKLKYYLKFVNVSLDWKLIELEWNTLIDVLCKDIEEEKLTWVQLIQKLSLKLKTSWILLEAWRLSFHVGILVRKYIVDKSN